MRTITVSLEALLSVLMAVTSASVSVCDLSCWLAHESSGCQSSMSVTDSPVDAAASNADMVGMDMGAGTSTHSSGTDAPPADQHGQSQAHHSMPAQMGVPAESLNQSFIHQSDKTATPDHKQTKPTCIHESCRQVSIASSSPSAGQSPPVFFHLVALNISSPTVLQTDSCRTILYTSPPLITLIEGASVPLRI